MSLSDAWKRKATVNAMRKSKARSDKWYTFVYAYIYCNSCYEHGCFRISVGNDHYMASYRGTKWFDTEFIGSFVSLLAHDAHRQPLPYASGTNQVKVMVITCPFPQGQVLSDNGITLDNMISRLLLVVYKNQHFAVLEFNLHQHTIEVFDGLNYHIDQWKEHTIHTLREYGMVNLSIVPRIYFTARWTSYYPVCRVTVWDRGNMDDG